MAPSTTRLILGITLSAGLAAAQCKANNCVRAVTGTVGLPPQSVKRADCSSALAVTVYPTASTVWVTSTTATTTLTADTSTSTAPVVTETAATGTETAAAETQTVTVTTGALTAQKRAASSVPAYASPCTNAAQYSSACSCWGVTASTVTGAASTVTSTSYATSTQSTTEQTTVTPVTTITPSTTLTPTTTVTTTSTTSAAVNPNPQCAGSGCGHYISCGQNNCICAQLTGGGRGICITGTTPCSSPACSKDEDCAPNSVCAVATCCRGGGGICVPVAQPLCPNPSLAARNILRRRISDDGTAVVEKRGNDDASRRLELSKEGKCDTVECQA